MFRAIAELLFEEIFERHWEGVGTDPFTTGGFAIRSFPIYTWFVLFCLCAIQLMVPFLFCAYNLLLTLRHDASLPGSSPGGSREFEAGTASVRIRKQLLN